MPKSKHNKTEKIDLLKGLSIVLDELSMDDIFLFSSILRIRFNRKMTGANQQW